MDIKDYITKKDTGGWGYEALLQTPIDSYCLIDMADWQMRKHMYLTMAEKDITLDMIGDSTTGISNKVSDEVYKYTYSYSQPNSYIDNYQKDAKHTTTREGHTNPLIQNYVDHNVLYGHGVNVYPDEDNTGRDRFTPDRKWEFYEANKNRNSIIHKTKELFNCKKINTIISRFHTDPDKLELYDGTEAKSQYGLSHGRNLLTYDAERNGISYDKNGYDNPYCRVWTHHHQYSKIRARLMRPFSIEDEMGNVTARPNHRFHNWAYFPDMTYTSRDAYKKLEKDKEDNDKQHVVNVEGVTTKWGWKDSGKDGWDKSVLDKETGLLNITPKYLGGAEKNIHTKDCMFSIENLAWQGYDPYSFERALSWEQRGPFGGRIMWFPPYGLNFNEDTSVNWSEHNFIGRGESVYTYTNTSRSGTLSFMMVVDHPSILDYSTWYGQSQPEQLPHDTDILRFFAGCDGGSPFGSSDGRGSTGLSSFARPTPLTDEYLQEELPPEVIPVTENKNPEKKEETKPEDPSPDEEITVSFYVFYPNNYSGYYDNNNSSMVNPIAYLLCGNGAQWKCNDKDVTSSVPLLIDFQNISQTRSSSLGNGYEMLYTGNNGISDTTAASVNYIIGTTPNWASYESSKYIPLTSRKWYYRIDGEYKVADKTTEEVYKNTFDQKLVNPKNYIDTQSFGLNCDIEAVTKLFTQEKENKDLYTLAEVAYALLNNYDSDTENADQAFIKGHSGNILKDERLKKLIEIFDTRDTSVYKAVGVSGIGYSNKHGNNPNQTLNDKRNTFLAKQRCCTAIDWFFQNYGYGKSYLENSSTNSVSSHPIDITDQTDASGATAKQYRSAKITIKFKKSSILEPKDMNQTDNLIYYTVDEYIALSEDEKAKCTPSLYEYIGSENIWKKTITKEEFDNNCSEQGGSYLNSFPCEQYVIIQYSKPKELATEEDLQKQENKYTRFTGFEEVEKDADTGIQLYINTNETRPDRKNTRWYYDDSDSTMKTWDVITEKKRRSSYNWKSSYGNDYKQSEEQNTLRYDQEYHFFKKLEATHPDVFSSLVHKLQYFDPAFHSMTPEGFMGRLNFLHQCTRQGDTIGASDRNGHSANNLAFGRPPFCILRLGDFYYQKIVIRNINIQYDPLVLDLNNEGIGVVPLIANVTISFNFIGGGDLSGPVRRLQNAMSFNYYANGRLYDNRADRVERENTEWDTMGAMGHDKVDFDASYFHHVRMSK